MATKTLQELQAEQATIDASYSAAAEKWANGEFDPTDVVTLLERAETAESNAENSANVASTAAIRAENSADTAATAGAEAGTTAGTAAGTTAGTTAAQSVYDTVFTQEHTYTDTQNFSDITIDGEGPIAREQAAWLMQNANTAYKADSYFTNLWADKQTDDIYIRRLYKYAYNTAPKIDPAGDSVPEKVTLTLKTGATRVYTNALYTLFSCVAPGSQYVCRIVLGESTSCYDPVLEHTLLGFWERCNYYKDENGDTRIVAVRGEEGFDKRKPDVGTFGPAIWFDVRDSLELDGLGNTMYTEVIVSTSPHPELGLHPHPLAMRHDGTVAPYWCCSAYPASLNSYSLPNSVYNGYTELSVSGAYGATTLTPEELVAGCRERGKGYGDGSYIASLLQLMHIIKYGTKDSQSIMKGVCMNSYGTSINLPVHGDMTVDAMYYDANKGAHWIPLVNNSTNKDFLSKCNAVWVDGIIQYAGRPDSGLGVSRRPYMITSVDEYGGGLRVWLETDYSIKYSFNLDNGSTQYKITAAKAVAGCTDNVYSKYDGPAMYSACRLAGSNAATDGYQPFRLHGIEYGLQWEIYTDKVWETPSGTEDMQENGTQGYYRLPWENKYADTASSPVHATTEKYVSYGYGTDYSTKVIASNYADSGYDIVISTPACAETTGSSSTGLCDFYGTSYAGQGLQSVGGCGGPYLSSEAGLFYYDRNNLGYGYWHSGAHI